MINYKNINQTELLGLLDNELHNLEFLQTTIADPEIEYLYYDRYNLEMERIKNNISDIKDAIESKFLKNTDRLKPGTYKSESGQIFKVYPSDKNDSWILQETNTALDLSTTFTEDALKIALAENNIVFKEY